MTAFPKLGRITSVFSLVLLVLGGCAVLAAVAAPYLGLGLKEEFLFYRLAEWSRLEVFYLGVFLGLAGLVLYPLLISMAIVRTSWFLPLDTASGLLCRGTENLRAYFALPTTPARQVFNRHDQLALLALATIFQIVMLFVIPLAFECDALMYYHYAMGLLGEPGGHVSYFRGPGFPTFLILTGQFLFDSFSLTILAQAALGILKPLMFYRILAPFHRPVALAATVILILSTTPFWAAKLILTEQLYGFMLLGIVYGFSRYYFTRDARFIHLTLLVGLAAFLTRWEASFPLLTAAAIILFMASKQNRQLRHLFLSLAVIMTVTGSWSVARSYYVAGDLSLAGSLHNWQGRYMFWLNYSGEMPELQQWEVRLGLRKASREFLKKIEEFSDISGFFPLPEDRRPRNFIEITNGPATQKMRDLLVTFAGEHPDTYRRLEHLLDKIKPSPIFEKHVGEEHSYYWYVYGRFDGDPDAFADNMFANPNHFYLDYQGSTLNEFYGIIETNQLYKDVVLEAFIAQPRLVLLHMIRGLSNLTSLFGVDLPNTFAWDEQGRWAPSFLLSPQKSNNFSKSFYNPSGCAETMPQRMRQENLRDIEITTPINEALMPFFNGLRNYARLAVGLLALLTWWFIPWAPNRSYVLCLTLICIPNILLGGSLIIQAYSRWELPLQALIILVTALGTTGFMEVVQHGLRRAGSGK